MPPSPEPLRTMDQSRPPLGYVFRTPSCAPRTSETAKKSELPWPTLRYYSRNKADTREIQSAIRIELQTMESRLRAEVSELQVDRRRLV